MNLRITAMTVDKVNHLLREMRALATQAGTLPKEQPSTIQGGGFVGILKDAVNNVNQQQLQATAKQDAFLRGDDIPLTEVMVAMQQARVSFEAVKQVRNRLLEAYQEVSRMQV
jgi:flagellar hook-basal body complex protein FliE